MEKGFIKLSHDWNSSSVSVSTFRINRDWHARLNASRGSIMRDLKRGVGVGGGGGGAEGEVTNSHPNDILYFPNLGGLN